jgi:hypothetical protein
VRALIEMRGHGTDVGAVGGGRGLCLSSQNCVLVYVWIDMEPVGSSVGIHLSSLENSRDTSDYQDVKPIEI